MKILIFLVLSICGLAISAPTCNYTTIDTRYVCLMSNSMLTSQNDAIGGTFETGRSATDVYRVVTLDPANKDLIRKVLETFLNLEVLQIQKGNILSIDSPDFPGGKCAKLKQLQILNGALSNIGSSNVNIFASCSLLEELDLSGNKLVKLETGSLPTTIKKLTLHNNTFDPRYTASPLFGAENLPQLTHLSLSGNGISQLTNFNVPTKNLIHLDFSNNLLTNFPTESLISNLRIQNLYLNQNKLTSVTGTFVNSFADLREIKLGSNLITNIDQDAFRLNTKLTLLDISANPLKTLNDNLVKHLTSLTVLDIHDIQMDSTSFVPLKTTLELLTNLQKLDISKNVIGAVDTLFIKNINLVDLSISNMNLSHFTIEIFSNLTKLQNLTFSNNQIFDLPATIFDKTIEMKKVIADGNKIVTLRASTFEKMNKLEVLDFTNNKINQIERTFFDKLTNLREVKFANNECINENFIPFNKNDNAMMAKLQRCFNNYNSARTVVISNILLVIVAIVLKLM